MNLFSLEGKVAFVTGGGSGIGQRIAVGLAEAGASVGCFDLASSSGLVSTVEQIKKVGCRAIALTGDVMRAADLRQAVDAVEKELGHFLSRSIVPAFPTLQQLKRCRSSNGSGC